MTFLSAGEVCEVLLQEDNNKLAHSIVNSTNGIKVAGEPFDNILNTYGFQCIDFLKMNIEGAEKMAVNGMQETISMTNNICIARHDFLSDQYGLSQLKTRDIISDYLHANGFRTYRRKLDQRPWIRDHVYGVRAV